jgi:hypothetical protein
MLLVCGVASALVLAEIVYLSSVLFELYRS